MDYCRTVSSADVPRRCEGRGRNRIIRSLAEKRPDRQRKLAANTDQSKKLASQLQAILPPQDETRGCCTAFRQLSDCVAALHVSHNLKIKFNCLKWDVTGPNR